MLQVYGTCPASAGQRPATFRRRLLDVCRWTDSSVCRGLLIFTDNYSADPWATAQFIIERTERLVPLVAAQPSYMHPFTAARMVCTIGYMYGRSVDLNLVAGGNRHHLKAVSSTLEHDQRYDQLVEYGRIMLRLLRDDEPVTYSGVHYDMPEALLRPPLPAKLLPRVFVAGASDACLRAAQALGVTRLTYPRAMAEYEPGTSALADAGIRVGIIARDTAEAAWRIARQRFPADPAGERMQGAVARGTESRWYHKLTGDAARPGGAESCYWLYPFRAAKEYCPYLVGSYAEVAESLAQYLRMGVHTLILQAPPDEDDIAHAEIALRLAESRHADTAVSHQ